MKYPKEWINELTRGDPDNLPEDGLAGFTEQGAKDILNRLWAVGALKEPAKPREWWLCSACGKISAIDTTCCENSFNRMKCPMIRVREVLE